MIGSFVKTVTPCIEEQKDRDPYQVMDAFWHRLPLKVGWSGQVLQVSNGRVAVRRTEKYPSYGDKNKLNGYKPPLHELGAFEA